MCNGQELTPDRPVFLKKIDNNNGWTCLMADRARGLRGPPTPSADPRAICVYVCRPLLRALGWPRRLLPRPAPPAKTPPKHRWIGHEANPVGQLLHVLGFVWHQPTACGAVPPGAAYPHGPWGGASAAAPASPPLPFPDQSVPGGPVSAVQWRLAHWEEWGGGCGAARLPPQVGSITNSLALPCGYPAGGVFCHNGGKADVPIGGL